MDSKRLFTLIGSWMILTCILVDHAAEGFIIRGRRRRIRHPKKPTGKQLAMEMAKFTDLLLNKVEAQAKKNRTSSRSKPVSPS